MGHAFNALGRRGSFLRILAILLLAYMVGIEKPLQALARHFRVNGTRWGHFRNLAEVPLFVDSKASRLVQLADLVAYATWRKYELGDGRFFDPLIPMFDADGGVIHGLFHYRGRTDECFCPACLSRNRRAIALVDKPVPRIDKISDWPTTRNLPNYGHG